MAKSKEVKRLEAEARTNESNYKAPERPCTKCKSHRNKPSRCVFITEAPIYVGRKQTCGDWSKK